LEILPRIVLVKVLLVGISEILLGVILSSVGLRGRGKTRRVRKLLGVGKSRCIGKLQGVRLFELGRFENGESPEVVDDEFDMLDGSAGL
jgi:hypothetical protein